MTGAAGGRRPPRHTRYWDKEELPEAQSHHDIGYSGSKAMGGCRLGEGENNNP